MRIIKKIFTFIIGFILSGIALAAALLLISPPAPPEPLPEVVIEEPEPISFSLCCPEDSPFTAFITGFADRWSSETACTVEILTYSSAGELDELLNTSCPDLLVCSGELSFSLSERGLLSSTGNAVISFAPAFTACSPSIGDSFFPIGAACNVLAVNSGMCSDIPGYNGENQFGNFESLLALALAAGQEGRVLFSADSFSGLFLSCMYDSHGSITAVKAEDVLKEGYVDFYNLLAEGFMAGGIGQYDVSCSELLQTGTLPAAILSSTQAVLLPENFNIYPMPAYTGSAPSSYAELVGFSVTCTDSDSVYLIYSFLSSFFTDSDYFDVALSLGYLPGAPLDSTGRPLPIESAFNDFAINGRLIVPEINGDYSLNHSTFEKQFREEVTLLYN